MNKTILFLLLSITSLSAQTQTSRMLEIQKLFFNLNVDTCIDYYNLSNETEDSTKNHTIKFINISSYPKTYLIQGKLTDFPSCDSTKITFQGAYRTRYSAHGKIDYKRLYGHSVVITQYFHDSSSAFEAYIKLKDSISKKLNIPAFSNSYSHNGIFSGKYTTFNIDSNKNENVYQRDLSISLSPFKNLFCIHIEYEKLTIHEESCY